MSAVTRLALRPYVVGDSPGPGSVPVSVVVLTRNEEPNIRRCLASVAWADQVIVVDSGSTDETMSVAKALGATVVEQPWLGFSDQREASLRLPQLRHDWLYFVDADQWVSPQLASEIAAELKSPECSAFLHRFRLVFMGKWIRHCGWYRDSWNVQLLDRRYAKYDGGVVGERVYVDGLVGRLRNDIVDDDLKGVAAWLRKHVHYAELEADRRSKPAPLPERLRALRWRNNVRSLKRAVLKDIIYPSVPAKPVLLFLYMYIVQLGFLDGLAGLRFCYFHAWFEVTVQALQADRSDS